MDVLREQDTVCLDDDAANQVTLYHSEQDRDTDTPEADAQNADWNKATGRQYSNLVDYYLAIARQQGASDLHISASAIPFMRRFGRVEFIDETPMAPEATQCILFEILSDDQKLHLVEHGALDFCLDIPSQGRYRASIIRQRLGWDGTFHIIRDTIPSFEELGLPEALRRLTEYQQGLILVTGPANSGKTTTLAALLDLINSNRADHIITIERTIEYVHTPKLCQITQREVGTHTESFAVALRAALRQDPDVLMVGELADLETLSMAISASETGHLVFGTLHTTSAARTVNKILDGFPVARQNQVRTMLSESLRGVISQRLVPRKDETGSALAMEIMLVNSGIAALLRESKSHQIPSIIQMSHKIGMRLMDESLSELVNAGIIEKAAGYRFADNKDESENFNGTKTPGVAQAPKQPRAEKRNGGFGDDPHFL